MGQLRGTKAQIHVHKEALPKFYKPRPVPYAMKPLVEKELQQLLEDKIMEPVKFSEWAAPIVPVLKPGGAVRICGDYKITGNRVSKLEQYPLDMSHAYQLIVLEDDAKKYVTVDTHKGLYTYCRLPFRVLPYSNVQWRTSYKVFRT